MPNLSPKTKQVLSGLIVGVTSAAGVAVEQALAHPPFTFTTLWHAAVAGALMGFVHYIPTLGTEQAVAEKLDKAAL